MACWICSPACDKCQPKFFTCPHCAGSAFFAFDECPACKGPVTDEDRRAGLAEWNAKTGNDLEEWKRV